MRRSLTSFLFLCALTAGGALFVARPAAGQQDDQQARRTADAIAEQIAREEEAAQAGDDPDNPVAAPPRRGRGARAGRGGRGPRGGAQGAGNVPSDQAFTPATRTTDLMLSEFIAQDPFILPSAAEGAYYLYTAGQDDKGRGTVVAYKSKDLKIWEGPQTVFTVPENCWANPRDGVWSPEIHEYNGKYYLFVTLHNRDAIFAEPPQVLRENFLLGTTVAESASPTGPFELIGGDGPHPPRDFMTSDGTLFVDENKKPWMVYCHEWTQIFDGAVEAVPLTDDLSATIGDPIYLFKASDGPWLASQKRVTADERYYISDGPEMFRTKDGHLLMLWSSHTVDNGYVQTVARSTTGQLTGPWEQMDPIVLNDSGHGMLFRSLEDQLMLVVQQPFGRWARARLYDMEDLGDSLKVAQRREDLDTRPGQAGGNFGGGNARAGRGRGGRGGAPRGRGGNRGNFLPAIPADDAANDAADDDAAN